LQEFNADAVACCLLSCPAGLIRHVGFCSFISFAVLVVSTSFTVRKFSFSIARPRVGFCVPVFFLLM
jgi:hypothetical protein